ncbi:hypothetical protein BU26DRAFT_510303 [Trematosphaeria pertusa]|uniref:Uncharacterized protein n=1 Tax=Trematosphaeria pertusa TaxID=390896 RepID=A0A6A6HY21_9PLEO|nr:uncharacterized protein BU26DRAFT_510303 [Trematosphaeria pertusa]KAF2243114.1 hypothetical protein BU26DRAFT_510303 [Trematosphaeria pertusa]
MKNHWRYFDANWNGKITPTANPPAKGRRATSLAFCEPSRSRNASFREQEHLNVRYSIGLKDALVDWSRAHTFTASGFPNLGPWGSPGRTLYSCRRGYVGVPSCSLFSFANLHSFVPGPPNVPSRAQTQAYETRRSRVTGLKEVLRRSRQRSRHTSMTIANVQSTSLSSSSLDTPAVLRLQIYSHVATPWYHRRLISESSTSPASLPIEK